MDPSRNASLLGLGELFDLDDDLGVDLELDRVAGERNCASEAVPVEAEVHPVELTAGADADALPGAEWVRQAAIDCRVERDRLGGLLDGELSLDPEVLVVDRLDAGELERDVGVLLAVEEVT